MDYRRFADTFVVRIDKGEEIVEQICALAEKEGVKLASVEGLGATDDFTVGLFDVEEKKFHPNRFQGPHEIVSLTGSVSTMDGAVYQHLHMSAADAGGAVVGGHLSRAVISATCEIFIRVLPGTVERAFDEKVGLNLFRFDA